MNQGSTIGVVRVALVIILTSVAAVPASAQLDSKSSSVDSGTPILKLIETVSKKTSKTFIVDPRVSGNANLIGLDPSKITYPDLLNILQVHGYAAVESNGIVRVIPDALVRTTPTPLVTGNEKLPDAEVVTRVVRVKSVPAAQLVPILRSLLPQNAHMAAMTCTNELIIVDTYANVRRIEGIIASMDKGDALALPKCTLAEPTLPTPRGAQAAPSGPAPAEK